MNKVATREMGMSNMHAWRRVAVAVGLMVGLWPVAASAAPITVGEFTWEYALDPTPGCTIDEPTCVFSTFSLIYEWDSPLPAPTLTAPTLTLPGETWTFLDLDPSLPFDQYATFGLPAVAALTTSFLFDGELVTLDALLTTPENGFGSAVLTFTPAPAPVPEPGTLALLGIGIAAMAGRMRRAARRQ
jgi:hypothetical protein